MASLIPQNRPAIVCAAHEHDIRWAEALLLGRPPIMELPTAEMPHQAPEGKVFESLNVNEEVDKRLREFEKRSGVKLRHV